MTWVKLDDAFPDNPKVVGLSSDAFRLYVEALCYCGRHLTDGQVPESAVKRMGGDNASELVDAGLWTPSGKGWLVNDYLEFNPSREKVKADRAKRAEAGKKGAEVRWNGKSDGTSYGKSHGTAHTNRNAPGPSRPVSKTSGPVDNSRPRLKPVEELRADQEVEGPPAPRDVALDAIRAMKGAK